MYNLLKDPCFKVTLKNGQKTKISLPEVFFHISRDEIRSFSNLQQHQQHSWHAFLVQLGALALLAESLEEYPKENTWSSLLKNLTANFNDDSPWTLVVDDLSKPAFFQPPVPEGSLNLFEDDTPTPDSLDILVTSKNHDVKKEKIQYPEIDHWIYALINLQTMQGVLGRGNYGISRMNGGYASKPCVSFTPSNNICQRMIRDTIVLIKNHAKIHKDFNFGEKEEKKLLWLDPWDGITQLTFDQLDPYYIEICRRIRFSQSGNSFSVLRKNTEASRIAEEAKGVTGDPWTPINIAEKELKCLTIKNGFSYELCNHLLDSEYFKPGICQTIHPKDPESLYLFMQGMTRGQGKTEGFHERSIPIPKKIRFALTIPEERVRLAQLSKRNVDYCSCVSEVLKEALLKFFQGGKDKLDKKDKSPQSWLAAYESSVDAIFFLSLWKHMEMDPEKAKDEWLSDLKKIASSILQQAFTNCSTNSLQYYKAVVKAESMFHYKMNKLIKTGENK